MVSGQQELLSWTINPGDTQSVRIPPESQGHTKFLRDDSAGFTKVQSVPLHRQKQSSGEELSHLNLLAHGSVVPRLPRIKPGPCSPGL